MPPAVAQASASEDDELDRLPDVCGFASQLLPVEVLRRPLDSAQYTSIAYTCRLEEAGIAPSVGSVGDSFDNALCESVIGLYKTEVIRRRTRWTGIDDVEYATLEWVGWFNHQRLFGPIGYVPPAEFEAAYYAELPSGDEPEAQIAPASGTSSELNGAPDRSEGLVSEADGRSEHFEDGSALPIVSVARRGRGRREVGVDHQTVGIQASESP